MPASVAGFSVFGNTSLHRFQNITFVTFDGSCHQFLFFPENLFQKAEKRMTIVEDALNRDIKPFCILSDGYHIQCFHADLHKCISFNVQIGSDCMRIISKLMFAFAAAPFSLFALNAAAIKSDVFCTTHMAHLRHACVQIIIHLDRVHDCFTDCLFLDVSSFWQILLSLHAVLILINTFTKAAIHVLVQLPN